MRVSCLYRLSIFLILFLLCAVSTLAGFTPEEAKQYLPDKVGNAQAQKWLEPPMPTMPGMPRRDAWVAGARRSYTLSDGQMIEVSLEKMESDSAAYALLTANAEWGRRTSTQQLAKLDSVGTTAFTAPGMIIFYRGPVFVKLKFDAQASAQRSDEVVDFARAFAAILDKGAGEIPALATHLPAWETAQEHAMYAVSLSGLQAAVSDQPVLDAVSFAGGTEAVTAKYAQGQLVIIEFQTPQLAADNDARIGQRIAELRGQNQPVPSAYRRVGNYAVFVFDAPSAQAANGLINQVKYEKVVQWLGEDPHRFERANRFWLNMSGSIIVNTIKATALAILLCLGIGGLFGSIIFARRRAQAALSEQYTDAGGMMRLNLDDLAAQPARLLPPGGDD
jgi:hypothetical protein